MVAETRFLIDGIVWLQEAKIVVNIAVKNQQQK